MTEYCESCDKRLGKRALLRDDGFCSDGCREKYRDHMTRVTPGLKPGEFMLMNLAAAAAQLERAANIVGRYANDSELTDEDRLRIDEQLNILTDEIERARHALKG